MTKVNHMFIQSIISGKYTPLFHLQPDFDVVPLKINTIHTLNNTWRYKAYLFEYLIEQ